MNTFVVKAKHRAWLFIEMTALTAGVILLFVFFANIWCSLMTDCGSARSQNKACIIQYFAGSCVSR